MSAVPLKAAFLAIEPAPVGADLWGLRVARELSIIKPKERCLGKLRLQMEFPARRQVRVLHKHVSSICPRA